MTSNGILADEHSKFECYRVILCEQTLRSSVGLLSYINLVEAWKLPSEFFGKNLPVQAHFDIYGDGAFDVRLAWTLTNGKTAAPAGDGAETIKVVKQAHFVANAVKLPVSTGMFWLTLEWRPVGTHAWQTSRVRYPVEVTSPEVAPEEKPRPKVLM